MTDALLQGRKPSMLGTTMIRSLVRTLDGVVSRRRAWCCTRSAKPTFAAAWRNFSVPEVMLVSRHGAIALRSETRPRDFVSRLSRRPSRWPTSSGKVIGFAGYPCQVFADDLEIGFVLAREAWGTRPCNRNRAGATRLQDLSSSGGRGCWRWRPRRMRRRSIRWKSFGLRYHSDVTPSGRSRAGFTASVPANGANVTA